MATMKFWRWDYTLKPKNTKAPLRKGALLKVQWPDGMVGYGDVCPFPDLGEDPLEVHLTRLKAGKMSQIMEQSIWLARRDAVARSEKRNLLRGLPRVRNNFLIQDPSSVTEAQLGEARRLGFVTAKMKTGKDPETEWLLIDKILRMGSWSLRLDFGASLTLKDYIQYMQQIPAAFYKQIEYVEDPFPFSLDAWRDASSIVPLAIDREVRKVNWDLVKHPLPFKVIVIKPARQDLNEILERVNRLGLKMVITSHLDHPLGVMHAHAVACETKKNYPNLLLDCGVYTHLEYQPDSFSNLMSKDSPMLGEVPETGIGFDSLLSSLNWSEL